MEKSKLKYVFPILNLISIIIVLILFDFAYSLIENDIIGHESPLILSGVGAIITFMLLYVLDRNEKFEQKFQINEKVNLKWIPILLISLAFSIILLIYYFAMNSFELDVENFDAVTNMELALFLVGTLIFQLIAFLLYFAIKNLNIKKILPQKFNKNKFIAFSTVSFLLLLVLSIGYGFVYSRFVVFPPAAIRSSYNHNDGPWLTYSNDSPNESISITWLTSNQNSSIVYYGTDPNDLDLSASGPSGYLHKVNLDGLQPETTYYYQIPEDFEELHVSDIFNFTTAPSDEKAFKFAVFGDIQPTNPDYMLQNKLVMDGLIEGNFDFVCQTGDVADTGTDPEDWHRVMYNFARLGANTPIQLAIGNHDWHGVDGSSNWAALFNYDFPQPNQGRFYSFDYLNAHFVMIDNFEHSYRMSDAQLQWIQDDIEAARSKDPNCWIFTFFHLSFFTTATSGHYFDLQKTLMPIFDKSGVDAVFFGHDHHYEHYEYTYGSNGYLFNKDDDPQGNSIHYFCTGGGGANLEVSYGVLNPERMRSTSSVTLWDIDNAQYETLDFERREWNSSRYLTHPTFEENYTTDAITGGIHEGKYYYHDPNYQSYDDYSTIMGFDYGEQTFQYMQVEIDGDSCTISARYPNGQMLMGPDNSNPQTWTLTK